MKATHVHKITGAKLMMNNAYDNFAIYINLDDTNAPEMRNNFCSRRLHVRKSLCMNDNVRKITVQGSLF